MDSSDPRTADGRNELWTLLNEEVCVCTHTATRGSIAPRACKQAGYPRRALAGANQKCACAADEDLGLDEIHSHAWRIQAASALRGDSIDDGIDWLVSDIADRLYGQNK